MRIPRIHTARALEAGAVVSLEGGAADHLTRVLRLKAGAALIVFNGQGGEYRAVLESVQRGHVEVRLQAFDAREAESPLAVTLVQGVSRGERMDYTIQKAVELGVGAIVPVFSERTVVNLRGERLAQRQRHWQAVAVGACEQCGRNRIPQVAQARAFYEWLDACPRTGLRLLLDPEAPSGPAELETPAGDIVLLVGPEGGLAPAEREAAVARGFRGVRLGPRILRTETAAVVALSALQALWGDVG